MKPRWTIGIVNHKSAVYVAWQLKILYEANPPRSFRLILVDNSRPPERTELERLTAPYRKRHRNLELVFHEPTPGPASMQHAEGLELIRVRTDTPLLLVQDPDFFWVRHDYLALLANLLDEGNLVVGAPYPLKVGIGDPWFPAAFGAAYRTAALENLDFTARVTEADIAESRERWPPAAGFGFSYDVGFRIRGALSDRPHFAFEQIESPQLGRAFGSSGITLAPREYRYQGRPFAYHLFRGTLTGPWTKEFADPGLEVPQAWRDARDRLGAHFYSLMTRDSAARPRRDAGGWLAALGGMLRGRNRSRARRAGG